MALQREIDMNLRNKWLAGFAIWAMFASAGAMAAVNANEMHVALTSLKLALAKIGVANAILSNPTPPSSNAEARLAAPNQLGSQEIDSILVSAGGVINVYLSQAVGVGNGIVQLVPKVVTDKDGKKGVQYTCYSPNIPDIATAAPECTYHPAVK
ncbi:MAG: hypothetical protein BGP23_03350 [Lysobacterales bacterium 66-474]|nr:MAG: hypothetical protein ABT18_07490 [Rhodanobacter sp. SCN 66-43]OJY86633.1 MAG: hypothetical protein BGP23_03350 [Xanthomonadales bacterium 66-474]